MSQSQDGSNTRPFIDNDSIEINISEAQNGGEKAKALLRPPVGPTGDDRDGGQENAMPTNAVVVGNTYGGTGSDFNGGGILSDTLSQQREPSPGPHMEEMETYIEEGGYIRVNGISHDTGAGSEEDSLSTLGSSQDANDGDQDLSSDGYEPDLRRVKVYKLVGTRWTDKGTAFCSGEFEETTEEAKLIARSEATQDVLLNTTIRASDVYQRQQDTLIVWTEPDGSDYALSFQDIEGCAEVWEFIIEVQRHLNANRAPDTAAAIISSGHLPPPKPDPTYLGEIEKAIRTMSRTPKSREQMCSYIQENKYIYQLVEVFEAAEKEENLDALHALCSCMQTILLLNEHSMYEHILVDELWLGVVGTLEYDPEFPKYKANYREFLSQRSRFLQPIAIDDQGIQRKIHHTYRLQYLKDVILGRALDDSTFNVLNSCIIFNQIDIIQHVQQDERILTELVALFMLPEEGKGKGKDQSMELDKRVTNGTDFEHIAGPSSAPSSSQQTIESLDIVDRKKEVILFLQQLCAIGKNLQLQMRMGLFKYLVERGVLYAVQWALCRPEKYLVSTAGEILTVMLDHHTLSVRNHILAQAVALNQPTGQQEGLVPSPESQQKIAIVIEGRPPPFKESLAQVLVRMLANCHDLALQSQLADALRMLLDVPQADSEPQPAIAGQKLMARPGKDDHSTERFLDNFYKVCAEILFRPLTLDVPGHQELKNAPLSPSRERGNLYLYLCDLLCSFAVQHSFRSFFFILGSNVVSRVASLLNVRDKHLSLAALRFFRICLRINNRNIFSHLDKHDCFTPITHLTCREAYRDNLLSSTCQEFFEFMRKENLRDPINYIMGKHELELRGLAKSSLGASTFVGFVSKWEINKEPPPPPETEKKPTPTFGHFFGRTTDSEDDDSYFLGGDDDESQITPVPVAEPNRSGVFSRRKRQRGTSFIGQPNRGAIRPPNISSHQRPQSPLSSLLEYDDDDDAVASPRTELPNPLLAGRKLDQDPSTPQSPILQHRQIEIPPYDPSSDPEDDLLESLVSKSAKLADASTPSPKQPATSSTTSKVPLVEGPKPREKRRRADEDDDMLEKLTSKNRRLASSPDDPSSEGKEKTSAPKPSEEGRKKLKLKFSSIKSVLKPSAIPPMTDTRDGDNG